MTRTPRSRLGAVRLVVGLAGLGLAATGVPALFSTPGAGAVAATHQHDGSDWNSTGLLDSDSALTLHWNNQGNPNSSVVYRDGRQTIPHTGGRTYNNITPAVASDYASYFGSDNGLGGLTVTVSQTRDLVNQTVSITASGAKGGTTVVGGNSKAYLQVFQCWGGLTAKGKPDPGAGQPDPATCQVGATGPDSKGGGFSHSEGRFMGVDPLATGGDWSSYYGATATDVPFTAIDGEKSGSTLGLKNSFFNSTTTNELSNVIISSDGTATRPFEIQTGLESPGLGCGKRPDVPSTGQCWLVVVPRITGDLDGSGPISPSVWAQRLQVRIGFRAVAAGCPGGARSLVGGSELLADATASWTPGLCDDKKIEFGYTELGDELARGQYAQGANPAILTSQPLDADQNAIQVPTALAAPVLAYQLTYEPTCLATPDSTEERAKECGYDSLAQMQQDSKRAGVPVRNLKLDARLVAKLLTQSYQYAIIQQSGMPRQGWELDRPESIVRDPEFLALNPDLKHLSPTVDAIFQISHLQVEAIRSDAAAGVWRWLLSDPAASAFLNGCPDQYGLTVNPFYSTRTYIGCQSQKDALAAQAKAERDSTTTAKGYVDGPLAYPPDGSPYPLPTWQEYDGANQTPQTVVDWLPPVNSMPIAGHNVAIGYMPQNSQWCSTNDDATCVPSPGKWKDPKKRQPTGSLGLMAITDAATAAQFQLPTASLCDSTGKSCVGASQQSLTKAANEFVPAGPDGTVGPGDADYAGGAYPLTMPVYTAISSSMDAADRATYADLLSYITTHGQQPGFDAGSLPPGYAPLTPALVSLANTGIAALRKQSTSPTNPPSTPPSTDSSTSPIPPGGNDPNSSSNPPPGDGPSSDGPAKNQDSRTPTASPELVPVSASTERWPGLALPLGLAIALLMGLIGPLMRQRSRFVIRSGKS